MTLFSTDTTFSVNFEQVDPENGVIKGVKMCSEGEAKGHGVWLNKKFISKVVDLAQKHERGVKARFGHPNMCSDALGTYIGVYKNVRRQVERKGEGETRHHAIGDLYLSTASKESPNGNLYNYILTLAKDSPDMFGSSIVFSGAELSEVFEDEKGNKWPIMDIESLFATDLVDTPAATDGLFSVNENDLANKVTEFLDTNPRVFELLSKKPQIVEEFMGKYNSYKTKESLNNNENMDKTFFDEMKAMYAEIINKLTAKPTETTATEVVENKVDLSAIEAKISEVENYNIDLTQKNEALAGEISGYVTTLAEKDAEISRLQAIESKFNELEAKGTVIKGLQGQEDEEQNLPAEVKSLREDLNKLHAAINPVEAKPKPINEKE